MCYAVPIITCLEFIREYLMKKIVTVQKEIDKTTTPLTPTATIWAGKLEKEATQLRVVFCGNGKYQLKKSSGTILENWVYWLETWKKMYSFIIKLIIGKNMWEMSTYPITLLPPKHHVPIRRRNKKNNEIYHGS
uniref:Uncharacterized protein n=1 Tax=Lactuca sativa TaxID=4236 RepID=A0A9R1XDR8_LACSA|nr:hypothetical protein LSAT_V11C400179890 [Lactuca sativa]